MTSPPGKGPAASRSLGVAGNAEADEFQGGVHVGLLAGERVAEGEGAVGAGAAGPFPLRLRRQPVAAAVGRGIILEVDHPPGLVLARLEEAVIGRQLLALGEGVAEEDGLLEADLLDREGRSILAGNLAEGAGVVAHDALVLRLGDL